MMLKRPDENSPIFLFLFITTILISPAPTWAASSCLGPGLSYSPERIRIEYPVRTEANPIPFKATQEPVNYRRVLDAVNIEITEGRVNNFYPAIRIHDPAQRPLRNIYVTNTSRFVQPNTDTEIASVKPKLKFSYDQARWHHCKKIEKGKFKDSWHLPYGTRPELLEYIRVKHKALHFKPVAHQLTDPESGSTFPAFSTFLREENDSITARCFGKTFTTHIFSSVETANFYFDATDFTFIGQAINLKGLDFKLNENFDRASIALIRFAMGLTDMGIDPSTVSPEVLTQLNTDLYNIIEKNIPVKQIEEIRDILFSFPVNGLNEAEKDAGAARARTEAVKYIRAQVDWPVIVTRKETADDIRDRRADKQLLEQLAKFNVPIEQGGGFEVLCYTEELIR